MSAGRSGWVRRTEVIGGQSKVTWVSARWQARGPGKRRVPGHHLRGTWDQLTVDFFFSLYFSEF